MMTSLDLAALDRLTPHALDVYRQAFAQADAVLPRFEIATRLRVQHFLAQCCHETAGLTVTEESLDYTAERLMAVWPSRFPTREAADPYAHQPAALANRVYGPRLGNVDPGDGWRYRGRGLLQTTGRYAYTHLGTVLGIDLAGHPELAVAPGSVLLVAAAAWRAAGCNVFADRDDLTRVTRAINGGLVGIASRRTWLSDVLPVVQGEAD